MATKTFSQIVSSMIARLKSVQPTVDTKAGTFARDVTIDAPANEMGLLYGEVQQVGNAQSPETGVGADIVRLAENYGLRRKGSAKATGTVTFYRSAAPTADITIAVGTAVSTVAATGVVARSFTVTAAVTLPVTGSAAYYNASLGRYEISTTIRATTGGMSGNVAAGTITTLTTPIDGLQGCTNADALTGGVDQESVDELKGRLLDVLAGNSVVTQAGIEAYVAATTGVSATNYLEYVDMPGTIAVVMKGADYVSTTDTFERYVGQTEYIFQQQPVQTTGTISVVGASSGTLVVDVDYSVTADTGVYSGTSSARTCLTWLSALPAQTITVTYTYNTLVQSIQDGLDSTSRKCIGQEILVREATAVAVDVGARIRVTSGYEFSDVESAVESALTTSLNAYQLAQDVQQSDIASIITAVAGVEEVQLPLATFTSSTITQNSFGDLEIPANYYASPGTIVITQ
jgi:uncharacterized phage protein gp47/JayE